MARTTSLAVQGILVNDYDGETSLTPYIETASSVVDDLVTCAADDGVTLSAAKLELIERWLAAYFYALMDKPFTQKTTADASAGYQVTKEYTNNYKEAAVVLDNTGCLAAILDGANVQGIWLGRPPSEQTDYVDRD